MASAQKASRWAGFGHCSRKIAPRHRSGPEVCGRIPSFGLTEFQSGETAESIPHYKAALKLALAPTPSLRSRPRLLKAKQNPGARTELEHAVALDPRQADAAYDSDCPVEDGEAAAALPHLLHAHALTPDRPDVSFNIILANSRPDGSSKRARQPASKRAN